MGKKSDIDKNPNCVANQCLPSERDLVESYNRLRTISTIGFVAGGLLAAGGVVLLVVSPASTPERGVALRVGPGLVSLKGSFQ
jgi:hypothetical protein